MMKPGTVLADSSKAMHEGPNVTTHIHLVRHGRHALLHRILCGRMPGVELDVSGREQMNAAARMIKLAAPQILQSSPQRRTLQSATIIAAAIGLPVEIVAAFDEIDMGQWTGMELARLAEDKHWRQWNEKRGSTCPPAGESMVALQKRVVDHLEQLRTIEGSVVILSHAEPIRAALMHYLGIPLDLFYTLKINPASVSTISLEGKQAVVSRVNHGAAA
jgi:broad specificity phosphatase PhoE